MWSTWRRTPSLGAAPQSLHRAPSRIRTSARNLQLRSPSDENPGGLLHRLGTVNIQRGCGNPEYGSALLVRTVRQGGVICWKHQNVLREVFHCLLRQPRTQSLAVAPNPILSTELVRGRGTTPSPAPHPLADRTKKCQVCARSKMSGVSPAVRSDAPPGLRAARSYFERDCGCSDHTNDNQADQKLQPGGPTLMRPDALIRWEGVSGSLPSFPRSAP